MYVGTLEVAERPVTQQMKDLFLGGRGCRYDLPPYRLGVPVTREEYESLAERYDKQMREEIGVDPEGRSLEERIAITRKYRMDRLEILMDAGYHRRGRARDGAPTLVHLKELGLDVLPGLVAVARARGAQEGSWT